jgi:hypothetical protein
VTLGTADKQNGNGTNVLTNYAVKVVWPVGT